MSLSPRLQRMAASTPNKTREQETARADFEDRLGYTNARAKLIHGNVEHRCSRCGGTIDRGDEHWFVAAFYPRRICIPCGQTAISVPRKDTPT